MDASHGPKRSGKIKKFAQLRPDQASQAKEQWRELGGIDESFRAVRLGVRLLASSPLCGAIEVFCVCDCTEAFCRSHRVSSGG